MAWDRRAKSGLLVPRSEVALPSRQRGFLLNPYRFGAPAAPSFPVDAADFDGTNDDLARASDWTGTADSKTGILSFWIRADNVSAGTIFEGSDGAANNYITANMSDTFNVGDINIWGQSPTNQYLFDLACSPISSGAWHHILASWDLAAAAGSQHFYVNGVNAKDPGSAVLINANINYTCGTWRVGNSALGADRIDACLAELYFAPGQYLDLSVQANREKFILGGKPVSLGATGSTPTGTVPKLYLHLDDAEAVANFATNRSGNGNMTVTGALTTCATSPSD